MSTPLAARVCVIANRVLSWVCGAWLACAALPSVALATPATDFSFFDADAIVLDFDEVPMTQSTVITTQYAGHGVTFSPNVWFENHRGALGWDADNIANFLTGTSTVNPAVEIAFSGAVVGAAMEWAANAGSRFLFEAVLGGTTVESYSHDQTGCCTAAIHGFQDVQFDTLRITHQSGSDFFIADQLTWQPDAVPEPSTGLLTSFGLVGLALLGRSRDRVALRRTA